GEILRGGDDGDVPVEPASRLAHTDELEPVGGLGQFLEIAEGFVVSGKVEIFAGLVAEYVLGGGRLGQGEAHRGKSGESEPHKRLGYHSRERRCRGAAVKYPVGGMGHDAISRTRNEGQDIG